MAKRRDNTVSGKSQEAEERRQRLASALRDNLARRKAQARVRTETPKDPPSKDGGTKSGRNGGS